MMNTQAKLIKRKQKIRWNLKKLNPGKLRLSIFRSDKHIEAQIIDDVAGKTLCSYSTKQKSFKGKSYNVEAATTVGKEIAELAKKAKISEVYFDRGGYPFHGRIKALAEAAREVGLKF